VLALVEGPEFSTPMGVLRSVQRPAYDELINAQVAEVAARKPADLQKLLDGPHPWLVG